MNFELHDPFVPQIGDAVTAAVEQAQGHLEDGNHEQARTALQEAEGHASTSDEYGAVAGVILSELGDEEWGRRVLAVAVERATTATGLATLAGYALQIGDMELARTIISNAETKATSSSDAMGATAIAEVFGDDSSLTDALYTRAEALASTCNDFILMAGGAAGSNPERTRRYLEQALVLIQGPEDREAVAEAVEEHLGDEVWSSMIRWAAEDGGRNGE